jgi:hypothetical protein
MREKNKKDEVQEVIWMKGMKNMVDKDEKREKERKFPEVIIMDKEVKHKKKQEEFYNANKLFIELDVI